MTDEELVKLAERITQGLSEVTKSEWFKWAKLAEKYGLKKALKLAEKMANDITLRPGIKKSYRLITSSLQPYMAQLTNVPQKCLFGYIGRTLAINTLFASFKEEDTYGKKKKKVSF